MKQPIISQTSDPSLHLTNTVRELKNSLQTLAPDNSQTTQLITFALVATAIVGITVYHYIKSHNNLC